MIVSYLWLDKKRFKQKVEGRNVKGRGGGEESRKKKMKRVGL